MYLVVYDDGGSLCIPYGLDPECDGAISTCGGTDVAIFATHAKARKAIAISKRFASLLKEQGKPYNEDFLLYSKSIRIRHCVAAK